MKQNLLATPIYLQGTKNKWHQKAQYLFIDIDQGCTPIRHVYQSDLQQIRQGDDSFKHIPNILKALQHQPVHIQKVLGSYEILFLNDKWDSQSIPHETAGDLQELWLGAMMDYFPSVIFFLKDQSLVDICLRTKIKYAMSRGTSVWLYPKIVRATKRSDSYKEAGCLKAIRHFQLFCYMTGFDPSGVISEFIVQNGLCISSDDLRKYLTKDIRNNLHLKKVDVDISINIQYSIIKGKTDMALITGKF